MGNPCCHGRIRTEGAVVLVGGAASQGKCTRVWLGACLWSCCGHWCRPWTRAPALPDLAARLVAVLPAVTAAGRAPLLTPPAVSLLSAGVGTTSGNLSAEQSLVRATALEAATEGWVRHLLEIEGIASGFGPHLYFTGRETLPEKDRVLPQGSVAELFFV